MGKQEQLKAQRREQREAEKAKGWKIDVSPYTVQIPDTDARGAIIVKDGRPVMVDDDFDVKGSLADILFNKELGLKPAEAFEAYDLAKKIRSANGHVILDGKEMARVRSAYDVLKGVSENMVEFLRRIKDAEEISLGEVQATE